MKTFFLVMYIGIALSAQQPTESRLDKFKARIGYQGSEQLNSLIFGKTNSGPVMVGSWPNMLKIPGLGSDWRLTDRHVNVFDDDTILFDWRLNNVMGGQIDVHCYHSKNARSSEGTFFELASRPATAEIPYGPTGTRIGRMSAGGPGYCLFQNCNVCVAVGCRNFTGSAEDIAKWLNAFIESQLGTNGSPVPPVPKGISVTPSVPHVGQVFTVLVEMNENSSNGRFILKDAFGSEPTLKQFMTQFAAVYKSGVNSESLIRVLRAKSTGKGIFKYVLVDCQTSQMSRGNIEINVVQ